MPFLRLHRQPDDGAADAAAPLLFTAATAGTKADGVNLADLPWDFSRGVKGGAGPRYPFLWVHDLAGDRLPLGVADVATAADELPLRIGVLFDPDDEFAQRVEAKYRSPVGGLEAVSVSWDDVDGDGLPTRTSGKKAVAHQLLEVSAVPVGLDPKALQEGERVAMRALLADLSAALARDVDAPPDGDSPEVSPATAPRVRSLVGSAEEATDKQQMAISEAIHHAGLFGESWVYIMGSYPDDGYVIVCVYSESAMMKHYRIDYTETDGEVALGAVTPVEIQQTAVAVTDGMNGGRSVEEGAWADVAAGMVEALTRGPADTDTARHRAYKRLLPAYKFCGQTPPEWIGGDELRALDDDNWRALFLSGELEAIADGQRVGAELSGRNVQELSEVRDAVQMAAKRLGVLLERVTSKSADVADDDGERAVVAGDGPDLSELAMYLETLAATAAGETSNG